uniref:Cytoplasmic tRNA 2-thiolation protein 2 n=1 Tax=Mastacembelus armatus TaxID=205130 RepID=A0A7N9AU61_9TELE
MWRAGAIHGDQSLGALVVCVGSCSELANSSRSAVDICCPSFSKTLYHLLCWIDPDERESSHCKQLSRAQKQELMVFNLIMFGEFTDFVTYMSFRGCFKEYFIHKFRAMLGKNRIIFPGEKVLLAVSGGPSSCSMLSQVQEGLSQTAHRKLRFLPGIVHIDEGGAVGHSMEERQKALAELQTVFKATGFPFYFVPLEKVLDLPSSVVATATAPSEHPASAYKSAVNDFIHIDSSSCSTPLDQEETSIPEVQESHTQFLQQLIVSVKTLTARQDLLNTLRQHLLVDTARTKGYSKLMLGDNCTRLAVKLLTSVSLGRGAQLAQDTGFSDSRYGDIISVRPMRDFSTKEIAYYNHIFSVPSVFIPGLDTKTTNKASIQHLTESFVTKLQTDFPSTVSTIYRTSEKLQTACRSSSTADCCDRCLLCMCSLDTAPGECVMESTASRIRNKETHMYRYAFLTRS